MKYLLNRVSFTIGWVSVLAAFSSTAFAERQDLQSSVDRQTLMGPWKKGAMATVHPLASQMGVRALQAGGNAVDAAIASALTLGVVDSHNSGIGGGCFILIRRECGEIIALDGREMAPAAAHRDMYIIDGELDPMASREGALAPGVPGALMAYHGAVSRYGRLDFSDLLLWAAEVAENGFPVDAGFAARTAAEKETILKYPATAAILLRPDGEPYVEGDILKQPDLAKTYRSIADQGLNWFYRGPFAEATESWMKENGGIMIRQDFANYHIRIRNPVRSNYKGYEIIGFPPPSSGGIHVAQILDLMEIHSSSYKATGSTSWYHYLAESMKLAFADRAHWLGDPDYYPVPSKLKDESYLKSRAALIDPNQASTDVAHGIPPESDSDWIGDPSHFPGASKHTTHLSAADRDGVWVALTTTLNTWYGSMVAVPGTGVLLNNQMDDFSAQPGKPNYFGLIGAEANAVQPGKRPLSSMSPTIVLKDGEPMLSVGAAGGPTIITQVAQALLWSLDENLPPVQALKAPRIHHQWKPERLKVESSVPEAVKEDLKNLGHDLQVVSRLGATQLIRWNPESQVFEATADPRGNGKAMGW